MAEEPILSKLGCTVVKRWFYASANFAYEFVHEIEPDRVLLMELRRSGVDLFTFVERSFLREDPNRSYPWRKEFENVAVMKITSFEDWWTKTLRKKERQSVKKAERSGIEVRAAEINDNSIGDMLTIYNETPFREGRRYSGYGQSIEALKKKYENMADSEVLGAYTGDKMVGLLWIRYGDRAAMFRSFVSLLRHRDKCPNNALICEAVRRCAQKKIQALVYGNKFGFLPGLDQFREHQGFRKCPLPRYYVPLTSRGQLAIELGVHRKIEYSLPRSLERVLLRLYNQASRIVPAGIWYRLGEE